VEKFLSALIKNTPLALIVIGLLLIVIGAAGGVEKYGLDIPDLRWRIALAVMGVVVAGFGALLIWLGRRKPDPSAIARECALKIKTVKDLAGTDQRVRITGTYRKKPPDKSVVLVEQSSAGRTHKYWFKNEPIFDEENKTWFANCTVRGNPGSERIFYVAILGEHGQALWAYYLRVGEETQKWPGIETLTPDIVLGAHETVTRKSAVWGSARPDGSERE
jgi:hypothetical protein